MSVESLVVAVYWHFVSGLVKVMLLLRSGFMQGALIWIFENIFLSFLNDLNEGLSDEKMLGKVVAPVLLARI